MNISLDNGITWQEAPNGVRIMVEDLIDPIDEGDDYLVINATNEGLLMDVLQKDGESKGILGTSSETYQEIVDRLC
jgi:hypothetical protein